MVYRSPGIPTASLASEAFPAKPARCGVSPVSSEALEGEQTGDA